MNQVSNHVCGHWPPSLAPSRELHTEGMVVIRTFFIQLSEEHLNNGQYLLRFLILPLFPSLSVFSSFVFSLVLVGID